MREKMKNPSKRLVLSFMVTITAIAVLVSFGVNPDGIRTGLTALAMGFATSMMGGIVVFLLISEYFETNKQRERLFLQMANENPTLSAIDELRLLGAHNDGWLRGRGLPGANLEYGRFYGANLQDINFRGANLTGANFAGADLRGALLLNAKLERVNFQGAALAGADLAAATFDSETILPDGTQYHEDVEWGKFTDPSHTDFWKGFGLAGGNYTTALFQHANLVGADLHGANLTSSDLRHANLVGADLHGANLTNSDLRRADLTQANLGGCLLDGAALGASCLEGARLINTNLLDAYVEGANLRDAELTGAILSGARLTSSDLTGATVSAAQLSAVILDTNTTLPSGTLYDPDQPLAAQI
jgi:uncharacterized protein YjbI with pentapeptide repeats